ncbi:MAG: cobalt-precorrin-5B (C(1))-methyltransferase [Rhodospirillales bacterium]
MGDVGEQVEDTGAARPLRRGWTTGTCATAAAAAAWHALLTGAFPDPVTVALPRGGFARLPLARAELRAGDAMAAIVKDAGDDPDVTHGALVSATVAPGPAGAGVLFRAGEGVGTVTLPGLPIPPGEPAINPGPRAMMTAALAAIAAAHGAAADAVVTIGVEGGAVLAEKTLNGRLGIRGGLSILGTTGVVVPFSCAAWIHSIHRGIDVARAAGLGHLAAATGSTSEAAVRRLLDLPEQALIDMGDFAGGTLKYLRTHPVPRLTLAGGFAKLVKLAQGHLFLHSSKSQVDTRALARLLAELGAPAGAVVEAAGGGSAALSLSLARAHRLPLADRIAADAGAVARSLLGGATAVEVVVFDRAGGLIGRAGFDG